MSIQNPYDHALKIQACTYSAQFLRRGFPDKSVRRLGALANVELALEIDQADFFAPEQIGRHRGILTY